MVNRAFALQASHATVLQMRAQMSEQVRIVPGLLNEIVEARTHRVHRELIEPQAVMAITGSPRPG